MGPDIPIRELVVLALIGLAAIVVGGAYGAYWVITNVKVSVHSD